MLHTRSSGKIDGRINNGKIPNLLHPGVDPVIRKLHEEMNTKKINRVDLADKVGIDDSTIGKWFTGERAPNFYLLQACFNALGFELAVTLKETP